MTSDAEPQVDPLPIGAVENPLDGLLGYQLRRASLMIGADLAMRLEDLSLTTITLSVLLLIQANPGVTQSEIGRQLAIKRANMAPLAAQLSLRGLIDRTRADGRSHGLKLSEAGEHLAHDAWLRVRANEDRFLARLSDAEYAALVALISRLRIAPDLATG